MAAVAENVRLIDNGQWGRVGCIGRPTIERNCIGGRAVALADGLLRRQPLRHLRLPPHDELAAWLISFTLHLAVLLILAYSTMLVSTGDRVLLTSPPVELEDDLLVEQFHFSPDIHQEIGALGDGGLEAARPVALTEADESQLRYELEPTTPVAEIRVVEFDRTVLESPTATENLMVKGAGSVGTASADGAVDRLTHEIFLSLEQRPTLVVWLFDQSGSLAPQREAIAKRFDRVYDELGVIEASGNPAFKRHKDKPLLTAVAAFGQSFELLTPRPTDDLEDIKATVRAIPDDPSGIENVFQSIHILAERFRQHRLARPGRNVMIVVFTDEAGDDVQYLDQAVASCRKYEMPVYVVGVPAPFGRRQAFVKYIDPDPSFDQTPQWLPVDQGPESLMPERIKLLFGGREEQEAPIDSGFGPFGLCRLAYETGGIFFMVHPNREVGRRIERWETAAMSSHLASFFDPRLMRNYRPDYVSVAEYQRLLASNRACAALVEAAQLSWVTPMENVRRRFPRIDDGQFARDLSLAQRDAARLEPKINRLVEILRRGEVDRDKVHKPRWQAGFDLALGRALAVKVRTEGYNAMLALAKQSLRFENEESDTWVLQPSDSVTASSALARDAEDARRYLQRVVAEHDGTPWALEASRELREPLGWEWVERFTDVAGRRARAQAAASRPDEPSEPQKPRRDPPKL